jgi:hypothetical protein
MSILFRWASPESMQNKQSIHITKRNGTEMILTVGDCFESDILDANGNYTKQVFNI